MINELILQEDENIKITLFYFSKADIGDSDWLKIEIQNKTEYEVQIVESDYNLNNQRQLENGEKYINIGEFGSGNKYDLIHYFHNNLDPAYYQNGAVINPKSSILAWKYLTNYASVLLDGRNISDLNVCALFQLDFRYKLNGEEINLVCENKPFCFEWVNINLVEEKKLKKRLLQIIRNPHYRWVNNYVTSELMSKENIVSNISTKDLIKGVLLREDVMSATENILFLTEIARRKASPNKKLTNYYKKRINKRKGQLYDELQYYWDNTFLDDVLNSELNWLHVHRILEVNAKFWSSDAKNTKKVYEYLATSLNFEMNESLRSEKIIEWAKNIKLISTSMDLDFMNYLKKYLDDETEFKVEDWSKYRNYGMLPKGSKPDTIILRVCDVAFVALLRTLNQFEYELTSKMGTQFYSLNIKDEILSTEMINNLKKNISSNDINFGMFEKELKLTPELKKKIINSLEIVINKS